MIPYKSWVGYNIQDYWNQSILLNLRCIRYPISYTAHDSTIRILFINSLKHIVMTAKRQALRDIQESLEKEGKCFLAFQVKLNPIMEKLVNWHINSQKKWQSSRSETE